MTTIRQPNRRPVAYKNEHVSRTARMRGRCAFCRNILEPLSHFRDENIRDTIVFFGSARILKTGRWGATTDDARDTGAA